MLVSNITCVCLLSLPFFRLNAFACSHHDAKQCKLHAGCPKYAAVLRHLTSIARTSTTCRCVPYTGRWNLLYRVYVAVHSQPEQPFKYLSSKNSYIAEKSIHAATLDHAQTWKHAPEQGNRILFPCQDHKL